MSALFTMHHYTHAIVAKPPSTVANGTDGVDYSDMRRQHECYVRLLRELDLEVTELDFGGTSPSNVILEDLVIVCNGIALLTKPLTKEEEVKSKKMQDELMRLGQSIVKMRNPESRLRGSDVLFTGREIFVGICETSNESGAIEVAEAFPEFACTSIKVPEGSKHFRSYVSVAGVDGSEPVLCVGSCKVTKEILRRIERESTFVYKTLTVPEPEAATCLYVNGTLIHRAIEEIPESFKVFCEKIDYARRSICYSELAKISSGLGSCSLLLRNP